MEAQSAGKFQEGEEKGLIQSASIAGRTRKIRIRDEREEGEKLREAERTLVFKQLDKAKKEHNTQGTQARKDDKARLACLAECTTK